MHKNTQGALPMQLIASADETSCDLHILGDISSWPWDDSDTSCADVTRRLAELPDTVTSITVHVNSFGGEVAEGIAIYNALKASKARVTTVCEGFACSIASVIFMAGDERVMRPASLLMVHNPWMAVTGNSADMRKAADDLDKMAELSKTAYLAAAGDSLDAGTLDALMDGETWISPEDAVAYGLATSVAEEPEGGTPSQGARRAVMEALLAAQAGLVAPAALVLEQTKPVDERLDPVVEALQEPADPFERCAQMLRK